jgi:hypothetical protein
MSPFAARFAQQSRHRRKTRRRPAVNDERRLSFIAKPYFEALVILCSK